ncbi:MAG: cobalamin-independent methionine synthase II family protein [Chloroflexi bacterium]|nr:cobalamin-independent methionine synthase II family protein [Chloroflexota bacterium]
MINTRSYTGLPFPTLVVGSLPRPQWVRDVIEDRKAGRLSRAAAAELLDDAVPSAIRLQERTGLDYISDGEWRRESYVKIFTDYVDGFQADLIRIPDAKLAYPAVVSKIVPHDPIALDEAQFLRDYTDKKVLVAVPSVYTVGRRMWDPEHSRRAYPTREAFMQDCIPVVRRAVLALKDLGVDAIQLDDPWLALLVDPAYREREGITDPEAEMDLCVRTVNAVVDGIEDVFISVHLCHAHFNRRHSTSGSYHMIMDALGRMHIQRIALELATPVAGGVDALKHFPADKILGLGVIDHCDPHVETPEEVVQRVEQAMAYVPAERISLNPDCGFSPSSANPMDLDEAYLKLAAMCRGAQLLREKYA